MSDHSPMLKPALQSILEVVPLRELGIPEAAQQALVNEMNAKLLRIGLDALAATQSGVSFAQAADDRENFPFLRRFHLGVTDILQVTIPQEFLHVFERLLAAPPIATVTLESFAHAALSKDVAPAEAALLRFLLFEALRLNLVVAAWRNESEFVEAGARLRDIDAIAEKELSWLVENAGALSPDDRPIQTLVAMGMESLLRHVTELKTALLGIKAEVDEPPRMEVLQAKYEAYLRSMNLTDATLLCNRHAATFDEQRIPVELLQAEHPLALEGMSRAAMDQRVKRLADSVEAGQGALERQGTAIIDIINAHLKKATTL